MNYTLNVIYQIVIISLDVKRLWNTLILDGSIPQGEIERMMDNSFNLVVSKMTKKDQLSILMHL
jgi:predicted DNA-binding protein (MmcQ/YjbR family)